MSDALLFQLLCLLHVRCAVMDRVLYCNNDSSKRREGTKKKGKLVIYSYCGVRARRLDCQVVDATTQIDAIFTSSSIQAGQIDPRAARKHRLPQPRSTLPPT